MKLLSPSPLPLKKSLKETPHDHLLTQISGIFGSYLGHDVKYKLLSTLHCSYLGPRKTNLSGMLPQLKLLAYYLGHLLGHVIFTPSLPFIFRFAHPPPHLPPNEKISLKGIPHVKSLFMLGVNGILGSYLAHDVKYINILLYSYLYR